MSQMQIEKNAHSKCYPFTIEGGWDDKTFTDLEGLKELRAIIDRVITDAETLKDFDKISKIYY
jgi:hypothetical protein